MKKNITTIVAFCFLFTLIASCSMISTPTPAPTSTPTATENLSGTQTAQIADKRATQTASVPTLTPTPQGVLYSELFSKITDEWPVYTEPDNSRYIKDGAYVIQASDDNKIFWTIGSKSFSNNIISVDIKSLAGTLQGTSANIIWRYSELAGNTFFYLFGIYNDGSYFVQKYSKGNWTLLIPTTYSKAFKPQGETNNVKIAAYGENAKFYINDVYVNSISDSSFKIGKLGLAISMDSGITTLSKFAFDNLSVYEYADDNPYLPQTPDATATLPASQSAATDVPTTTSNAKLDITIKVFNNCDTPQTVIFQGPTYLKYKNVQPGETREMQAAQGTYTYTSDCCGVESKELTVSVWTLTLCYKK